MEEKLYKWQEECLKRWQSAGCRGMVQAVTGAGKTLLALAAVDRLLKYGNPKLKVKIVVPTSTLMQQWSKAIRKFQDDVPGENECRMPEIGDKEAAAGETGVCKGDGGRGWEGRIGLRGGGFKDSPDCRFMIYVINSARYELARQILEELKQGESIFLIADECHHYDSGQNSLIFEFLPFIEPYREKFFTLGLSATLPSGQHRQYLASVLGPRIYSYGMKEATLHGTVCQYDVFHIRLSFQKEERAEYEDITDRMTKLYNTLVSAYPLLKKMDVQEQFEFMKNLCGSKDRKIREAAAGYMGLSYKRKNLVCMASERIDCALALICRLDENKKILIFGERIRQAEMLYERLNYQYPGKVGRYHSQMGIQANKNALERFRTGQTRILIACKAIDEGVDVPDASIGIILSGTATRRQRLQRLGRILRINEGKDRASLYYLHIDETSEDVCFLPDSRENTVFELEYDSGLGRFLNPAYEEAALQVLEDMENAGLSARKAEEARYCLSLGLVRADWKRKSDNIEGRIRTAGSIRERNYWLCMKRVAMAAAKRAEGRRSDDL